MNKRICLYCHKKFTTYHKDKKRGKYCSWTCRQEAHLTSFKCLVCGKEKKIPAKFKNKRKYCSWKCRDIETTPQERFWKRVEKTNNCWIRKGATVGKGYNVLRWDNKQAYAHRVSWIIHYGKIPTGKFVCHKCDNPRCVNPQHLFLGTQLDNLRDMIKKGRRGYTGLPGEKHPDAKLTDKIVLRLRKIYRQDKVTQQELANKFGVTQQTISKAISGFTWKHLS